MTEELLLLDYERTESVKYGRDAFYALKRKFDSRYPEYLVEMVTYHDASNLAEMKSWHSTEDQK
jgi:hypothetical protein